MIYGKHAYLILCHNNFHQLCYLLSMLDDKRNDIYIHVDKKAGKYPKGLIQKAVRKSNLYFVPRIRVAWGGYSVIEAQLILLREAVIKKYDYYHMLSGMDLPLKTQNEIHDFFDLHMGEEFVFFEKDDCPDSFLPRVNRYYFFQEMQGRGFKHEKDIGALLAWPTQFLARHIQEILGIERLTDKTKSWFFRGSQWVSITHDFANYVLSQTDFTRKYFRWTSCGDTIYFQTLIMKPSTPSVFRDKLVRDHKRIIDWNRGDPYIFRTDDYSFLKSSDGLFARKFDENIDSNIIKKLYMEIVHDQYRTSYDSDAMEHLSEAEL